MLSQVRFFVPTVEMHASPAAVAFWQGQVASAMRMPADGDAFRAAAQAVAAASAGTHYSYARDGAQRSTTILGGLDGRLESAHRTSPLVNGSFSVVSTPIFTTK